MTPTIGISEFFRKNHTPTGGNSYTIVSYPVLVSWVRMHWDKREPGFGEGQSLDRKVVVPIPNSAAERGLGRYRDMFLCPFRVPPKEGMLLRAEAIRRPGSEDSDVFVEVFVTPEVAYQNGFRPDSADHVKVVCYSAEALTENGGKRTTDDEWEIIALICEKEGEPELMHPLTMARNFLEKPGGTKGVYTAEQFAEAIWYHRGKGIKVRNPTLP